MAGAFALGLLDGLADLCRMDFGIAAAELWRRIQMRIASLA